ncbi:RDD family protein [Sporosarcina sp. FSL W8-0480]|uniref:RDD family protein n=1 Tax=Sporosarcina sp. FSL W8-0480 TaxID=2954701 RepID=UPI0030DCBDE3
MNYENETTTTYDNTLDYVEYAGFWIRFGAAIIDGVVLVIPLMILSLIFTGSLSMLDSAEEASLTALIVYLAYLVGVLLYFVLLTSGPSQGTLGKMMVGIKVVDRFGEPISKGRSFGRFFSYYLSGLFLNIGYIIAGFTPKKQALHDYIVSTYVVKR